MAAVSNANFQQIPTHSNAPYISAKQRLLNDWADANIAPNMIQGKIVKRKRSGDNKENANSQNSKRSKSTNSATKNAVPLENPVVLQNIVNSNNLQNIVAQNAVGRTFKRRGSSQNLAEKKVAEKKEDNLQNVVPKKLVKQQKEDEPVVTEAFLMSLDPRDPLGLKLLL